MYLIAPELVEAFSCGLLDLVDTDEVPDLSGAVEYRLDKTLEKTTAEDGPSTVETVWKCDGETVEIASLLDSLTSLDSNGYASGITPEGAPEITFRIYRERENFSEVTLCIYAYNSTSCLVTLDGVSTVTVRREDAANLIASVRSLLE